MRGFGGQGGLPAGCRGGVGPGGRAASPPAAGLRGGGGPEIVKAENAPRFTVGSQSPRESFLNGDPMHLGA